MGEYTQSSPSNSICDQTRSFSSVNMHRNHLESGGNAGSDSAALSWGVCMCVYTSVYTSVTSICDSMDCRLPGSPINGTFQAKNWNGLPFSSSRDPPDPGIEPVSPALQADSLSAEPSGSPGWGVRSCISNIAPPSPPWFPTGDAEPAGLGTTRWGARQTEQPFSCGQQSLNCTAWREA